MYTPVFVLIDCNNFFASCERLFRPDLQDKPVAVLSNNDGCIVARSNEVKALGIPMGAPFFKYKSVIEANRVQVFSANFHLYGDISQRVSQVLQTFSPRFEAYSVDEAFLEIGDLAIPNYDLWARQVAATVYKQIGIPVSVGVGPTKTLAKVATEWVKKRPHYEGGFSLVSGNPKQAMEYEARRVDVLQQLPLGDVWGIGRRYGPRLERLGLRSAYDFTQLNQTWVLEQMTIRGLRTQRELKGESCLALHESTPEDGQKSIAATRSFGHNIKSVSQLEQAVATFAARAAIKLRRKGQITGEVTTFISTGKHNKQQFSSSNKLRFTTPTSDTAQIISLAHQALYQAYDDQFAYKRAGVILTELVPPWAQQTSLLQPVGAAHFSQRDNLMKTIDATNAKYGKRTIRMAAEGVKPKDQWHSLQQHKTPAYTTSWGQLVRVKI